MKPNLNNKYGYKICSKERKGPYQTRFMTHSYKSAARIKRAYVNLPLCKLKKKQRYTWHIIPITKREVKRGLWRQNPF